MSMDHGDDSIGSGVKDDSLNSGSSSTDGLASTYIPEEQCQVVVPFEVIAPEGSIRILYKITLAFKMPAGFHYSLTDNHQLQIFSKVQYDSLNQLCERVNEQLQLFTLRVKSLADYSDEYILEQAQHAFTPVKELLLQHAEENIAFPNKAVRVVVTCDGEQRFVVDFRNQTQQLAQGDIQVTNTDSIGLPNFSDPHSLRAIFGIKPAPHFMGDIFQQQAPANGDDWAETQPVQASIVGFVDSVISTMADGIQRVMQSMNDEHIVSEF